MTNMLSKHAQNYVVAGLGKTGLACARYFSRHNKAFRIWDTRTGYAVPETVQQEFKVPIHCGAVTNDYWTDVDVLVLSPGIAPDSPAVKAAKACGVEVIGDIELFARAVTHPVLGITGSNGKTTVTLLTAHIINALGIKAVAAGNVGLPALDSLTLENDITVLELSSFQLETTASLKLAAATLLNLSADHLDRHHTLSAYAAAKQRIFNDCAVAVVNRQDGATRPQQPVSRLIETGLCASATDFGWNSENAVITYNGQHLLALSDTALVGLHNVLNIQTALALVSVVGGDIADAAEAVKTFKPAPHRCTKIAEVKGVSFIDDSKATNIGATQAALEGLTNTLNGRLILIAGGDAKGADLRALTSTLADYVDTVIAIGKDGYILSQIATEGYYVESLEAAVTKAFALAQPGDTVLLSPACASLDMFTSYQHRAEVFYQAVKELAA
ncbi:UDP-N-acetylmuramoyl-L-alanine--D-glutamate ligase [Alteromonas gilva]|uniref:UDP-N-acetylmuramoylalanine--D-glutamate ligase n=1 Tax=Alteromonas gilva TaxID=2987522 RepID=A0ABT5L842_9ALTE|nr:UDP-N-acetylmuramoyl-L-alanine--D-glutamate ligase [Alteromonas gilva]MDC8832629.1 UDP-N-acetylmuramoyl-L-alanine--D-glutamate ligase [Alteromonas gilva]